MYTVPTYNIIQAVNSIAVVVYLCLVMIENMLYGSDRKEVSQKVLKLKVNSLIGQHSFISLHV